MQSRIKRLPEEATRSQCLDFLRQLVKDDLEFHLEDSPAEIVSTRDDLPFFNKTEVSILQHNIAECYRVITSRTKCPIHYMMKYMDARDKKREAA